MFISDARVFSIRYCLIDSDQIIKAVVVVGYLGVVVSGVYM